MKTLFLTLLFLLLCYSGFTQWERQYPIPTESNLYDSFFVDNNNGWVVGEEGTILHTMNGGTTWYFQYCETTMTLRSVVFTDLQTGWIVGGETHPIPGEYIILSTSDGGSNWYVQKADNTACLNDVFFIDSNIGWAVGENGTILYTDNSGNDWISKWEGSPYTDFKETFFVDSMNGWAAGEGLYKTSNGGENWELMVNGYFYSVFFTDTVEGWTASPGFEYGTGKLLHSMDAFNNWDTLRQCGGGQGLQCGSNSIFFKDDINGWMLSWDCFTGWWTSCYDDILKTQDGGETWEPVLVPQGWLSMNSLSFTPEGLGCIVGSSGLIMTTTNWSDQWVSHSQGNSNFLYSISFSDDMNGWAVGSAGYANPGIVVGSAIIHTSDGGQTWNEQTSPVQAVWKSVCFVDPSNGWATGNDYDVWSNVGAYIIYSPNEGTDWRILKTDPNDFYNDVFFIDGSNGWVVGKGFDEDCGIVLNTNDGGNNWQQITIDSSDQLTSVHFLDSQQGWTVGDMGSIHYTSDGGYSWQQQYSDTELSLQDVFFRDHLNGFSVGYSLNNHGIILQTTDGGQTWLIKEEPQHSIYSIYFSDENNGLIAGYYGTILLTNNGGASWNIQESGYDDHFYACYLTEGGNGYVAGMFGAILHAPQITVSFNEPKFPASSFRFQIYPNPSCGISDIRYQISDIRYVTLEVYDITGQKIKTLVHQEQDEGEHSVQFNGSDFPAGVYFVRLQVGESVETQKLILINNY